MKICQIAHVIFQTTSQFFFQFYVTLQCHEIYSSVIFLGQTLYALHERDQSKCRFFRLFSVRIKIHQILVIFEAKKKFLFKFCTTLWYHETQLVHTFFSWNYVLSAKIAYQSTNLVKFHLSSRKSEILHCGVKNNKVKNQIRSIISHDIEEWCKV